MWKEVSLTAFKSILEILHFVITNEDPDEFMSFKSILEIHRHSCKPWWHSRHHIFQIYSGDSRLASFSSAAFSWGSFKSILEIHQPQIPHHLHPEEGRGFQIYSGDSLEPERKPRTGCWTLVAFKSILEILHMVLLVRVETPGSPYKLYTLDSSLKAPLPDPLYGGSHQT